MKKNLFIIALFVIGLCNLPAVALDFMGPPCASLEQGQYSLGFNYSYSDMDIDVKGRYFGYHAGSIIELPKELKLNKYYGVLGYGIRRNWDAYFLLGAPQLKTELRHSEVEVGCDPLLGIGTKLTFYEVPQYKLGAIAQLTYAGNLGIKESFYITEGEGGWYHTVKGELDMMEIQIAAGPTYMLNEYVSVYGGPFLHFISGDFKHKEYCSECGLVSDSTDDVREASWFGGYIGLQINLTKKVPINVEWQHTAFADAIAASIVMKF